MRESKCVCDKSTAPFLIFKWGNFFDIQMNEYSKNLPRYIQVLILYLNSTYSFKNVTSVLKIPPYKSSENRGWLDVWWEEYTHTPGTFKHTHTHNVQKDTVV